MTGGEVLYFFAISGLLIAGAYFAVRWLGRGFLPTRPGRRMVIRETMGFGPRSGLCLVEVDGRRLVVGFGQAGMSLICDLGADAGEPPIPPANGGDDQSDQRPPKPSGFQGLLTMAGAVNRWLRAGTARTATGPAGAKLPVGAEMSRVEEAIRSLEQSTQTGTTPDGNRSPGRHP